MSFFASVNGVVELWALIAVCAICAAGLIAAVLTGGFRGDR